MAQIQTKNSNRWIKIAILSAAATFLTGMQNVRAEALHDGPGRSTIVVSATGEASTRPDMAILRLGVRSRATNAQQALSENSAAMTKIMAKFKQDSIAEKDIQTSGLSVEQVDDSNNAHTNAKVTATSVHYEVMNSVVLTVRDLAQLGKIIDDAVALGVNTSNGLVFTNANSKPFEQEARKDAINEAIMKAQTLAQASNLKLGSIINITEKNTSSGPIMMRSAALLASPGNPTPVAGGELHYTVTLKVVFGLN